MGRVIVAPSIVLADPNADIQAAIDAAPAAGADIYLPATTKVMTNTLYFPCDRPINLIGQSMTGTVLQWTAAAAVNGMVAMRGDASSIKNMTLQCTTNGAAASEMVGYGIKIGRRNRVDVHPMPGATPGATELAIANYPLTYAKLENVRVLNAPGWGIYVPGQTTNGAGAAETEVVAGTTISFYLDLINVESRNAQKYGQMFFGGGTTTTRIKGGALIMDIAADKYYALIVGSQTHNIKAMVFEGVDPTVGGGFNPTGCWVKVHSSFNTRFDHAYWEMNPGTLTTSTYFLEVYNESHGTTIDTPIFVRDGGHQGQMKLIKVTQTGPFGACKGVAIINPFSVSVYGAATDKLVTAGALKDTSMINIGSGCYGATIIQGRVRDNFDSATYDISLASTGAEPVSIIGSVNGLKVPVISTSALEQNGLPAGAIRLDSSLGADAFLGNGMRYGWAGSWKMVNNAPTLTTTERDAAGFNTGDIVINKTTHKMQIKTPTTWVDITTSAAPDT
jgi:hypothetical protein